MGVFTPSSSRSFALSLVAVTGLLLSACSSAASDGEAIDLDEISESSPVSDEMRAAGASTMADVLDALGSDFLGPGDVTFLAPSDRAFLTLDADVLASLLANEDELAAIVEDHLLDGSISIDELVADESLMLDSGELLGVEQTDDGSVVIGSALLSAGDLKIDGTTIHVIDGFLTDVTDQRLDQ